MRHICEVVTFHFFWAVVPNDCVWTPVLLKTFPPNAMLLFSGVPHMQKNHHSHHIHAHHTPHTTHHIFLFSCPTLKNEIQKSAQVTLSTSLVIIVVIIIIKTHQMSLMWGWGEKKKAPPQTTPIACNICLFVSPFSLFSPGSIRFLHAISVMIVKLWNFQKRKKKYRGEKRKKQTEDDRKNK